MKKVTTSILALTIAGAYAMPAMAAPAAADDEGGAIIVTGTRTTGMKAVDSPAPIQVLGGDILKRTGSPDMIQSLAQNLPQIQAQGFGGDLAALSPAMKLRGLSPNHTLILVNGHRRHGTANVNVSGGPFGGGAAPDISFILPGSVDHVEVLTDGAAAQYGTDAIAGVINFIQKKNKHGGDLSVTGGHYFDQGGRSFTYAGNIGIEPFEGAYLDIAAETKSKDYSFRGDVDPRVYGPSSTAAGYLNNPLYKLPGTGTYPYVNRIEGDPQVKQTSATFNAGYQFNGFEVYSFGSIGRKVARANENYRTPDRVVGSPVTTTTNGVTTTTQAVVFPSGFSPKEEIQETDYQITGGFKGTIKDTTFDLAVQYSKDEVGVYTVDSANISIAALSPTGVSPSRYHDGTFSTTMFDTTLDLTHAFDIGLGGPLNVAGGLEFRKETYGIASGDPTSYYGSGAQSFFGYTPNDAGNHNRKNFAQYLDVSVKPVKAWIVDGAVRHEHFSDFGDTTVFKLTSRYDFSPAVAVRGTVSTGFRAPTLAEQFYSGLNVGPSSISGVLPANSAGAAALGFGGLKPEKSTSFSAGLVFNPAPKLTITIDAYQTTIRDRIIVSSSFYGYRGQYCPANLYNAQGTSPTVAGCVATYSQDLYNLYNQSAVYNAVSTAVNGIPPFILTNTAVTPNVRNTQGSVAIQTFANGVKMRTRGIDFLATYASDFGGLGHVDWSLSMNYNDNKVLNIAALPSALYQSTTNPTASALISRYDVSNLQDTTPKFRATAGAFWKMGKFSANLRESFYAQSKLLGTAYSGADYYTVIHSAFITDLELGYDLVKNVKLTVGANNLTNHYPTQTNYEAIRAGQLASGNSSYGSNLYPSFSPYGINGGYYYGRVSIKW